MAYEFQHDDTRYLATGDAAGGFVAEAPTFAPAQLPPPDLDLMAWCLSIDVMEHVEADQLLVAHFGACPNPKAHLHRLRESLQRQYHCIREAADPLHAYRHMLEAEATEAGVIPRLHAPAAAAVEMSISGCSMPNEEPPMKPADCIELGHGRWIPKHAISFEAIRASGPGGQHVNKVATAVRMRVVLEHVKGLNPESRQRLVVLAGEARKRWDWDASLGCFSIAADQSTHRDQALCRSGSRGRISPC